MPIETKPCAREGCANSKPMTQKGKWCCNACKMKEYRKRIKEGKK